MNTTMGRESAKTFFGQILGFLWFLRAQCHFLLHFVSALAKTKTLKLFLGSL